MTTTLHQPPFTDYVQYGTLSVMAGEFLTIEETASILGVSTRHARRLADAEALTRIARGLIDRGSVDRYLAANRQGRTRAWAEHTAWGAVALLAGQDADWLGTVQASRLRSTLRDITDVDDLLTRMRDRAQVHVYEAHRAALPRLRDRMVATNLRLLGISDAIDENADGYLATTDLDSLVRTLGLRTAAGGTAAVRTTGFDFHRVRDLVATTTVAALDAATSTNPRISGVGRQALDEALTSFRTKSRPRGTIGYMTTTQHHGSPALSGRVGRLVQAHRDDLLAVLAQHGVTNPEIFGSTARGDEHDGSDLDLLVDLAPGTDLFDLVHIKAELQNVLGVPVDLVPRDGLKERVRMAAEKDLVAL